MKNKIKNQAEANNQKIKLNSSNHADTINTLVHIKLAMTAAVKGLRTMPRSEWDKTYSELMRKCSDVLAQYGGSHEKI